jgi:hypothetical protein
LTILKKGRLFFEYALTGEGRIFLSICYQYNISTKTPTFSFLIVRKTNKFGMPLLDILGVGGLFQSFTIGIAFLSAGSEGDYNWSTKGRGFL